MTVTHEVPYVGACCRSCGRFVGLAEAQYPPAGADARLLQIFTKLMFEKLAVDMRDKMPIWPGICVGCGYLGGYRPETWFLGVVVIDVEDAA